MAAKAATVRELLLSMLWADRLILGAVRPVKSEDLTRDAGVSFRSVLGTLAHTLISQRLWLSRFLGNPLTVLPRLDEYPDLPAWIAGWEEMASQIEAFLAGLSDDQLATPLTWASLPDGAVHTLPLWHAVIHLVNHSTYHRGQVVSLLRQMGYSVPHTDLIVFFTERAAG
ncbi:MAG TPA: DinB family protein [Thermoanaerobaculia bacterium]|nr:DinB family protein [Thermoanaerobaculia bacterium]